MTGIQVYRANLIRMKVMQNNDPLSHNPMNRRQFLAASVGAGVAAMLAGPGIGPGFCVAEPADRDLESLFESDDPRLVRMAADVMRNCVLAKIKPPEGTAKHRWLQAGTGDAFYGQWIWDTMFVVDLLAILPEHKETIRDVFQNYWDFQERWNARFPDYAHDMVATMIEPRGNTRPWWEYPAFRKSPSWAGASSAFTGATGTKNCCGSVLCPWRSSTSGIGGSGT